MARPRGRDLEESRSVALRVLLMFTCIRIFLYMLYKNKHLTLGNMIYVDV